MGELVKTACRTRRVARTAGLGAIAAATAFALTACQSDDDSDKDNGGDSSSSAGSSGGSDDEGSGDEGSNDEGSGGSDSGSGSTGGGEEAGEGSGGSGDQRATCAVGKVSVEFQQSDGSMPVILIKATNNGNTRCDLYGHPFVGYPDAQSPLPAGGGKPQSVVSLEKGESAYSALGLEEGEGADMHREKALTVQLADKNEKATGGTVKLRSPGSAGLALGDKSAVSYWNTSIEGAMQ